MKRLLLVLVAFFVLFGSSFAKVALEFKDFDSWMKSVKLPGYSLLNSEIDDSDYTAMFTKGSQMLQVRFGDAKHFDEKYPGMEAPYTRNGLQLKYLNYQEMCGMYVHLPQLKASLYIGGTEKLSKNDLEELIDALKINSIKASESSKVGLPADIPSDERLEGIVRSCEKKDASTDGYKFEYHVKYEKNKDLANNLRNICKKWNGSIDVCGMKQFTLVCGETDSIESLESMPDGTEILFIYYKNN